jgi:hypothetical protein
MNLITETTSDDEESCHTSGWRMSLVCGHPAHASSDVVDDRNKQRQ